MIEAIVEISGETGLFAENASHFVGLAGKYTGSIRIVKENTVSNAKSILNVLSLGLARGEHIKLRIDGPDEHEALTDILHYLSTMP